MVGALTEQVLAVPGGGEIGAIGTFGGGEFGHPAAIQVDGVGEHGEHHRVGIEPEAAGEGDRGEQVGDAADPEQPQSVDDLRGDPSASRRSQPEGSLNSRSTAMASASSTAITASVLRTLWIHGMCLSPIPSMRCDPYPLRSIVGHCNASTAAMRASGWASLTKSPDAIVPADPVASTTPATAAPGRAAAASTMAGPVTE